MNSNYEAHRVYAADVKIQGGLEPPELLGDLGDLTPCASCSKKSDQSSARDSFLVPPSGKKSVDRAGVLGVLCHGDKGTRRFGFDAPGRARPACSRCSVPVSKQNRHFVMQNFRLTICPGKEACNYLQNLEFLGISSFQSQEMQEVVGDELSGQISKCGQQM